LPLFALVEAASSLASDFAAAGVLSNLRIAWSASRPRAQLLNHVMS
jgi:hypothetical protein